jgi:hypothetical protein
MVGSGAAEGSGTTAATLVAALRVEKVPLTAVVAGVPLWEDVSLCDHLEAGRQP